MPVYPFDTGEVLSQPYSGQMMEEPLNQTIVYRPISPLDLERMAIINLVNKYHQATSDDPYAMSQEYGMYLKQIAEPLGIPVKVPSSNFRKALLAASTVGNMVGFGVPGMLGLTLEPKTEEEAEVVGGVNTLATLAGLAALGIAGARGVKSLLNRPSVKKISEKASSVFNRTTAKTIDYSTATIDDLLTNPEINEHVKNLIMLKRYHGVKRKLAVLEANKYTDEAVNARELLDQMELIIKNKHGSVKDLERKVAVGLEQIKKHVPKENVGRVIKQINEHAGKQEFSRAVDDVSAIPADFKSKADRLRNVSPEVTTSKEQFSRNIDNVVTTIKKEVAGKNIDDLIEYKDGKYVVNVYDVSENGTVVKLPKTFSSKADAKKELIDNMQRVVNSKFSNELERKKAVLVDKLNNLVYSQNLNTPEKLVANEQAATLLKNFAKEVDELKTRVKSEVTSSVQGTADNVMTPRPGKYIKDEKTNRKSFVVFNTNAEYISNIISSVLKNAKVDESLLTKVLNP